MWMMLLIKVRMHISLQNIISCLEFSTNDVSSLCELGYEVRALDIGMKFSAFFFSVSRTLTAKALLVI